MKLRVHRDVRDRHVCVALHLGQGGHGGEGDDVRETSILNENLRRLGIALGEVGKAASHLALHVRVRLLTLRKAHQAIQTTLAKDARLHGRVAAQICNSTGNHALRLNVIRHLGQIDHELQGAVTDEALLNTLVHGKIGYRSCGNAPRRLVRGAVDYLVKCRKPAFAHNLLLVPFLRREVSDNLDGVESNVRVVVAEKAENGRKANLVEQPRHRVVASLRRGIDHER